MDNTDTRIGWIGLGKMGNPMSGHFLDAGYSLFIYSRHEDDRERMSTKGAHVKPSPAALVTAVDVLFLMVPDDEAVREIFLGDTGILKGKLKGKTIVNMSTVSPGVNRDMHELCLAKGAVLMDAPVSGSVKQAAEAKLVIMAGGDPDVFDALQPLFSILGSSSSLIGDIGSGNLAKLAVNLMLGVQAQGLAEMLNFAQHHGVAMDKVMGVINNGVLGSTLLRLKGDMVMADIYHPAFAMNQLIKDLDLAKAEGLDSPLANVVRHTFSEAGDEYGSDDIIAIKKYLLHPE